MTKTECEEDILLLLNCSSCLSCMAIFKVSQLMICLFLHLYTQHFHSHSVHLLPPEDVCPVFHLLLPVFSLIFTLPLNTVPHYPKGHFPMAYTFREGSSISIYWLDWSEIQFILTKIQCPLSLLLFYSLKNKCYSLPLYTMHFCLTVVYSCITHLRGFLLSKYKDN